MKDAEGKPLTDARLVEMSTPHHAWLPPVYKKTSAGCIGPSIISVVRGRSPAISSALASRFAPTSSPARSGWNRRQRRGRRLKNSPAT